MKTPLSPWMFAPIRCAAKTGFLSRYLWNNVIAHGTLSWRNEQWRILKAVGLFTNNTRYGHEDRILVLTTEGRKVAKLWNVEAVMPPFADFISHDEIAAEFALRLEADGLISSWLTEAELKRDGLQLSPDSESSLGKSKLPDLILRSVVKVWQAGFYKKPVTTSPTYTLKLSAPIILIPPLPLRLFINVCRKQVLYHLN